MPRLGRTLALPLLLGALSLQCGDAQRPPNVVVIALDTLRPDHLGCYGHARGTSPNLDRFAANSVVFDNAQSAAPWTAPSLLSLMTSLYPSVHGVSTFPDPGAMSERVTTLAEVLKSRGYATAAFTDGGYAKRQFGLGQGFDLYPLNEGDTPDEHASNVLHPSRLVPNLERTLRWVEEFKDEPFFLFFHTYEVHGPYRPPEADLQAYRPDYREREEHERLVAVIDRWLEKREIDADGVRLILKHKEHCNAGNGPEQEGLYQKLNEFGIRTSDADIMDFWRDLYDAEIRHTDRELARLFERLERGDLAENTIVVVVSDHGEGFGEHGYVGHGNALHDEALRVVLMMRAPGFAARRVSDVVTSVDVMPTVLELAGAREAAPALQGRSVVPALRGETLPLAPTFSHSLSRKDREGRQWSVREGRWRLVWDEEKQTATLFDVESDPRELAEVSAANPKVTERLLGLLRAQRDIDATFRERASGPPRSYELSPADIEELRKLGYMGPEAPDPSAAPRWLPLPRLGR
jgi:arylsulfatase A-like enzyme